MEKVNVKLFRPRRRKNGRSVASPFYHLRWSVRGQGQGQRSAGEEADVFSNTLVGVVGPVALDLHAVIDLVCHPSFQVVRGEPTPPLHLQHLVEVEPVNGYGNVDECQHGKSQ